MTTSRMINDIIEWGFRVGSWIDWNDRETLRSVWPEIERELAARGLRLVEEERNCLRVVRLIEEVQS